MTVKPPAMLLALTWALQAGGCGDGGGRAETPDVIAGVEPVAYLAQRIAGARLGVGVLVPSGQDPHAYWPGARQMTALARARLLLTVDLPLETRVAEKLAARSGGPKVVNLAAGLARLPAGGHADHDDGHPHGELDPHVWMSPRVAKVLAGRICEALCSLDAGGAAVFRENLRVLEADLDRVDAELAEALGPLKGRTFYVFHPCLGYLARDYGLKQQAVETGGKAPGAKHLKDLIASAEADGVKVIFVQPQFPQAAAQAVAEKIGGAVVPLDPLARDYIDNLRRTAAALSKALGGGAARVGP